MKLAFHQLRYELRLHRWAVGGWLTLVTLALVVESMEFVPVLRTKNPEDASYASIYVLSWLVFIGLVVAAAGADSPSRKDRFVSTRPMPLQSLWLGKTLFVLLAMIGPCVAQEGLNLVLKGWTAGLVFEGMLERLILAVAVAVAVGALSSLWGNIKEFILGQVFLGIVFVVTLFNLPLRQVHYCVNAAMPVLVWVLWGAVMLAAVAWANGRYHWKGLVRGVIAGAAVVLVTAGICFWPWDSTFKRPGNNPALIEALSQGSLSVGRYKFLIWCTDEYIRAKIQPELSTLPNNCFIDWQLNRASLVSPSGKSILMTSQNTPEPPSALRNVTDGSRQVAETLGRDTLFFFTGFQEELDHVFAWQSQRAPLMTFFLKDTGFSLAAPATIKAELTGDIYQWEKALVMPLVPGKKSVEGGTHWKIVDAWVGKPWYQASSKESESVVLQLQCDYADFMLSADSETTSENWPAREYQFALYRHDHEVAQFADGEKPKVSRGYGSACSRDLLTLTFQRDARFSSMVESNCLNWLSLVVFRKSYAGKMDASWKSPALHLNTSIAEIQGVPGNSGNKISDAEFSRRLAAMERPDPKSGRRVVGQYVYEVIRLCEAREHAVFDENAVAGQLAAYVPDNLAVFLDGFRAGAGFEGWHELREAIKLGITEAQKEELLAVLPQLPYLIEVVVSHGWTKDARPAIDKALESHYPMPLDMVRAAASFEEPTMYPAFLATLEELPSLDLYETLRLLPGIEPELDLSVQRIWNKCRLCPDVSETPQTPANYRMNKAYEVVIRHGNREAFERAYHWFEVLRPEVRRDWENSVIKLLNNVNGPGGGPFGNTSQLAPFLEAHQASDFVFDKKSRRFVLKTEGV